MSHMYTNKVILAPMVRMGTLPFRLLALEYGADLVYGEEIVDKKMIRTKRIVNNILGTIDYVDEQDGSLIFRTCDLEKNRVVFQLGTNCASRAFQVAKHVEKDVAGFDVNMGCPKEFSIKGGMGSALLTQPDKVKEILETLVAGVSIPVTCKIRLLPNMDDTLSLCKLIETTRVAALAVHGRKREERPRHPNNDAAIQRVTEELSIPVIANGGSMGMDSYEGIKKFWESTKASSVMIARAAQWNCSVFRRDGPLPVETVIKDYLKLAIDYDNEFCNTKYCIQMMLRDMQSSDLGRRFLDTQTMEELSRVWGMEDYYREKQEYFAAMSSRLQFSLPSKGFLEPIAKKSRLETTFLDQVMEDPSIIKIDCRFRRSDYPVHLLPKTVLLEWTKKAKLPLPVYRTQQVEKLFLTVVRVNDKEFAVRYLEKNKKCSEQAAALACLRALNIRYIEKSVELEQSAEITQ